MHRRTLALSCVALFLSASLGAQAASSAGGDRLITELALRGERTEMRPEVWERLGVSTGGGNVPVTHIRARSGSIIRIFGQFANPPNDYFFVSMTDSMDLLAPVSALRVDATLKPIGRAAQSVQGHWRSMSDDESSSFVAQEVTNWITMFDDLSNALSQAHRRRLRADLDQSTIRFQIHADIGNALGIGGGGNLPTVQRQGRIDRHLLFFGSLEGRPNEYFFGLVQDQQDPASWAGTIRVDADFKPIGEGAEKVDRKWRPLPASQTTSYLGVMMRAWTTVLNR